MPAKRIHKLAKEAIRRLRVDGIEPTLDEIVWLHELANATEQISDPAYLLFASKKVGNISIYPMTIGARVWMITQATEWFQDDELMFDLAILYAYSHSRNASAFKFETRKEAGKAILRWAKTLEITEKEILSAFTNLASEAEDHASEAINVLAEVLYQIKENPLSLNLTGAIKFLKKNEMAIDSELPKVTWPIPYVAALMHYYPGKSEEEWLWDTSEQLGLELIKKSIAMEKVEDDKADPNDPALLAFSAFKKAERQIRSHHAR